MLQSYTARFLNCHASIIVLMFSGILAECHWKRRLGLTCCQGTFSAKV